MNKKLLLGVLLISIFSCDKSEIIEDAKIQQPQEVTVSTRAVGDGKRDVLGYGYNCLHSLGDNYKAALNPVINIVRYEEGDAIDPVTGVKVTGIPKGKVEEAIPHGSITQKEVYGSSLDDFYRNLKTQVTVNTNSLLSWGSSQLTEDYDETIKSKTTYSFYKVDICVNTKRMYFNTYNSDRLKYFLTEDFRYALKNYSAKKIVDDYGTHVLTDIYIGGKLSILASAIEEMKSKNELTTLTSDFAKYLTTSYTNDLKVSSTLVNTSLNIIQYGGKEYLTNKVVRDKDGMISTNVMDWNAWLKSVNIDTSILIDSNVDHLVPIWEFIDNEKLRKEVIAEIEKRGDPPFEVLTYPSFTLTKTNATVRGVWLTDKVIVHNSIVRFNKPGKYTVRLTKLGGWHSYFININKELRKKDRPTIFIPVVKPLPTDSTIIQSSSMSVELPKDFDTRVEFRKEYGRTGLPAGPWSEYNYFVPEYEDELSVTDEKGNVRIVPIKISFK